ncbi:DUF6545 domain-containing protein [Microtetraspora malaysiensis]|uniref:DUF6545 domain-containing protein n=1 Tax=Microtetraspora malaysiensis TaxID=161358 RepID=A0ABW6SM23_9ACTN
MNRTAVLAENARLLSRIDVPRPFDIDVFADRVSALRGRPMIIRELPDLPAILAPCVLLLVAGMSVSAVAAWWQRSRDYRAYLALEPLWRELAGQYPQIVLPIPGATLYQRLHRRVIEIRDGLAHLRDVEPAETMAQAREAAAAAGLKGGRLEDVAEACWIAAALEGARRFSEEPGPSPDQGDRGAGRSGGEPAVPPDRGRVRLRGGGTVAEEIAILSGVSRALVSSSLVRRSALASDGGTR